MKLQSAKDILIESLNKERASVKSEFTALSSVADEALYRAAKEIQRKAVQYALQVAAEKGKIHTVEDAWEGYPVVSRESILSLEQQILKDLGI